MYLMEWAMQVLLLLTVLVGFFQSPAHGLGSMSSIAAAYGGNGPAFCGLRADGSHIVDCFGSNVASVYGAPMRLALSGLTAGDGFICGLTIVSQQPYCWGNNLYVQQGVPASKGPNIGYTDLSAGDNHLCALRLVSASSSKGPFVDCWGFNITGSFVNAPLLSITAGSLFTCGLFASNRSAICWGDETSSGVISGAPKLARFESIAAGGYHVCGILSSNRRVLCWGRQLDYPRDFDAKYVFNSLVGGKFHACGLLATNHTPLCWGLVNLPNNTPVPIASQFLALVAGDYYTCGIAWHNLQPSCWGSEYPAAMPIAVSPGLCSAAPCGVGKYQYMLKGFSVSRASLCSGAEQVCVACSQGCPPGMYESSPCGPGGDRQCALNCSLCSGSNCPESCIYRKRSKSIQTPIIIGELAIAVVAITLILVVAYFWVRHKLSKKVPVGERKAAGSAKQGTGTKMSFRSFHKEGIGPNVEEPKIARAEVFSFLELEKATGGFPKESEVGKGSFSCVYRGVLSDGRVVAVKRAAVVSSQQDSKEFENELDLLSRLNHAHLLNLLGFCDDGEERMLVYEYMCNGTLHEQLHRKSKGHLSWIRRVTIAVQAARGLEYLHGYACPPVIHRDIKSSNILLDDEWNARVSDFGLSLLGPTDSNIPLSELPAGTLGYLDPEYYRLHYLTTKSDVYSFGVLLLEILSGRKAIDMKYDEGNIVEWSVPLIKAGEISAVLDPRLEPPPNLEAMQRIAKVAARCVKMKGKDRPSMDKVTTALERALAILMGTPADAQPILPSEVVLGSSRFHRKSSIKSSCRSYSEVEATSMSSETEDHHEHGHPSSVTFPSIASSRRNKSSVSDEEDEAKLAVGSLHHDEESEIGQGRSEIYPASPREQLYLNSNF